VGVTNRTAEAHARWLCCAAHSRCAPSAVPALRARPLSAPPALVAAGPPRPRLHRDWAHPGHACTRTGLTPATPAPGLGSPRPRLHRDWAHPSSERATGRLTDPPSTTYPHGACRASSKHLQRQGDFTKVLAQPAQPGRPAGRSALGVLQSLATDANRALSDATAYGRVALACLRHRRSDAFSAGGGYRCSRGSMTV
jgi:hypothetical protein